MDNKVKKLELSLHIKNVIIDGMDKKWRPEQSYYLDSANNCIVDGTDQKCPGLNYLTTIADVKIFDTIKEWRCERF